MQFRFMTIQEVSSETKVTKNIYLFDLFFILVYISTSVMLGSIVSSRLKIPYYIFSVAFALFFTMKSRTNRKRRNFEGIILFLQKDREIYMPVMNVSKKRKRIINEEDLTYEEE